MNPRSTGHAVNCTQLVVDWSMRKLTRNDHGYVSLPECIRNGLWPCKEKSFCPAFASKDTNIEIARCARVLFWYFERLCKIDMNSFLRLVLSLKQSWFQEQCLDLETAYRDWQSNFASWCIACACHFTSAYAMCGLVPGAEKSPEHRDVAGAVRRETWKRLCRGSFGDSASRRVENDSPYRCLEGSYFNVSRMTIYTIWIQVLCDKIWRWPQKLVPKKKYILRSSLPLDPFIPGYCSIENNQLLPSDLNWSQKSPLKRSRIKSPSSGHERKNLVENSNFHWFPLPMFSLLPGVYEPNRDDIVQ